MANENQDYKINDDEINDDTVRKWVDTVTILPFNNRDFLREFLGANSPVKGMPLKDYILGFEKAYEILKAKGPLKDVTEDAMLQYEIARKILQRHDISRY